MQKCTVFENHRKSLISQHFSNWNLRSNSATRQVNFYTPKLVEIENFKWDILADFRPMWKGQLCKKKVPEITFYSKERIRNELNFSAMRACDFSWKISYLMEIEFSTSVIWSKIDFCWHEEECWKGKKWPPSKSRPSQNVSKILLSTFVVTFWKMTQQRR